MRESHSTRCGGVGGSRESRGAGESREAVGGCGLGCGSDGALESRALSVCSRANIVVWWLTRVKLPGKGY